MGLLAVWVCFDYCLLSHGFGFASVWVVSMFGLFIILLFLLGYCGVVVLWVVGFDRRVGFRGMDV